MEKQNTKGTPRGKLGIGDYVVFTEENSMYKVFKKGWIYKITAINKVDNGWPYELSHTCYWNSGTILKKATKQEYIVAKLKGKLYE